jgi:hypothetical protein
MKLRKVFIESLLLVILVGCQSNPVNKAGFFSGTSHADANLKRDTMKMISMLVGSKGCNSIDHVNTKVVSYEPSNGQVNHEWGKEIWKASGCSKNFSFVVSFTEDGAGGTFFSVSNR